jgi:hypothetical protein
MSEVRLQTPHVTALMADGSVLSVQVLNPDYLNWDRTAAKHNWASMQKIPFTWLTFVTWSALRRTGQVESTWDQFSEVDCLQVTNTSGDDTNGNGVTQVVDVASLERLVGPLDPEAEPETVGPTPPGHAPG